MKNVPYQINIPPTPDPEAMKRVYCLCASCKHNGICKYYSKFIEFQQSHFPAKIDCWKYERIVENENN